MIFTSLSVQPPNQNFDTQIVDLKVVTPPIKIHLTKSGKSKKELEISSNKSASKLL